jgi:hypothetical protein
MGLFNILRGVTKPTAPNLDQLFRLPTAALTLQSQLDLVSNGRAGVCYKQGTGETELATTDEITGLLTLPGDATQLTTSVDDLGFSWVLLENADLSALVTRVHGVHDTLVQHGLGARLLCSVFSFVPATPPGDGDVRLVYLAKSGTFYPFAPRDGQRRDNELEIRVRTFCADDLPIEPDLGKWMALWGVPVA